jgi:hypothetical protein
MDFYNIAITCFINILIIIIFEGILYFNILSLIFSNILNSSINSVGSLLNTLLSNNYNTINSKLQTGNNQNNAFVSQALKLYFAGTFANERMTEIDYIKINDIKSYISYTVLIVAFFVALLIIKIVNYIVYNNKFKLQWKTLLYNTLISIFLLIIFILPIVFIVFLNIQNNIDTNNLQYQIIKIFQKLFT